MKRMCLFLLLLVSGVAAAQQPTKGEQTATPTAPPPGKPPVSVSVDGVDIKFPDVQPQPVAGRMMVPLRGVFETLGVYVEYDPVTRKITARKGNEDIELRIGDKIAKKNGAEILLDVAPLLMKTRAMVPLRFLVETLGGKIDYDGAKNHIDISTLNGDLPPAR